MYNSRKLLFVCMSFYSAAGFAAGFDCNKATTVVEKSICANPELSELDELLNGHYAGAKLRLRGSEACLKADQVQWLRSIRNACKDDGCLKTAYLNRLSEFNGLQPGASYIKYLDLPNVPSLEMVIPPLEGDHARGKARPTLEVTGTLLNELVDGDGYIVKTETGRSYILALAGLLDPDTAGNLSLLERQSS